MEDVGHVSQVEDVVELDGGRKEGACDSSVEQQCRVDERTNKLVHLRWKASKQHVLCHYIAVDVMQSVVSCRRHKIKYLIIAQAVCLQT